MSDKRLLKRCGSGKRYLNEMNSASPRPSGLRIRRAEVWTKMNSGSICSGSMEYGNVLFRDLGHRASEHQKLRLKMIWNCLRFYGILNGAWKTLRPRIPLRREKGQPEGSAVTGITWKPWVAEKGLVPTKQPVRITVIWLRYQPWPETMDGNFSNEEFPLLFLKSRKSEVGSRKSEVGSRKSEVRSQKSEVRSINQRPATSN